MPLSRRALLRSGILGAAIFAAAPSSAATLTWMNTPKNSWNLTDANWNNSPFGNTPWTNSTTATADFDNLTTPGTITIDGSSGNPLIEVNHIAVTAAGYTLAPGAGNLTFAGTNPTFSTGDGSPVTITAPIFGSAGLTFTGHSTITLGGVSTYGGGTNLVVATVIAAVNHALPVGGDVSVGLHSTLDVRGTNQSFGELTLYGDLYAAAGLDSSGDPDPSTGHVNLTSINGSGNIYISDGGILTATVADPFESFAGNINLNSDLTDGTLDKEGTGVLALTGSANLTGAFSSAAYFVGGGTLAGTTSNLVNSIFVNTGATLEFQQNANGMFNGAISGAGHVQVASASTTPVTITFANANTYSGDTTLFSNATLAIDNDNELGTLVTTSIGTVNGVPTEISLTSYASLIFEGGTLRTTNAITSSRNLQITALGGTIDTDLQSSTFSGSITELAATINGSPAAGTGPLTITGGGTATFSALFSPDSSFDSLIVSDATVIFSHNRVTLSNAGTSLIVGTGSFTLENGAALTTGGTSIDAAVGSSSVVIDGAGTQWTASGNVSVGTGFGTGSLTLQNFATATTGKLVLSSGFGTTASLTIATGARLESQSAAIGNVGGSATASVSGVRSAWTIDQNLTLADIVKSGTPASGSLAVSDLAAVSVAGITSIAAASTITVDGASFTTGALANLGNSTSIAIADASASFPALTLGSDTAPDGTFTGVISNYQNTAGSVVKVGSNTQTLSAANTYTGTTTVNGGNLILAGTTGSSSFIANNTGTLTLSGLTINLGFNAITANAGGNVVYNSGTAITGGYIFGTGTHTFTQGSLLATQIFNGAQVNVTAASFTAVNSAGAIAVSTGGAGLTWNGGANAGSLAVNGFATANVAAFTSSGVITVNSLGTLNVTSADLILSGGSRTTTAGGNGPPINGHPTIILPGSINLTAGNAVQLNGGLLINNGTISGPTYVNFGGVAKGSGTYGQVFVTDGGTFSPGNSPGNVTTADASWGSAGNYQWQISDATGTAGTGFDHWTVNGGLTITAGQTANSRFVIQMASLDANDNPANAADFNPAQNYSWEILSASAGITGFDPAGFTLDTTGFTNNLAGGTFSLSESGNALDVNFTPAAVPEPASLALLALPLLLLLPRRRKPV